tara:strand:- start:33 stop:167 length:135 start_codon:yes stop_codon:yes gene_type:complete
MGGLGYLVPYSVRVMGGKGNTMEKNAPTPDAGDFTLSLLTCSYY